MSTDKSDCETFLTELKETYIKAVEKNLWPVSVRNHNFDESSELKRRIVECSQDLENAKKLVETYSTVKGKVTDRLDEIDEQKTKVETLRRKFATDLETAKVEKTLEGIGKVGSNVDNVVNMSKRPDKSAIDKSAIIAALKRRQAHFHSGDITWSEDRTKTRWYRQGTNGEMESGVHDGVIHVEHELFAFDGEKKMYFETANANYSCNGPGQPWDRYTSTFNGREQRFYWPPGNPLLGHAEGTISSPQEQWGDLKTLGFRPIILACRPLHSRVCDLDSDDFVLDPAEAMIDGHRCAVLKATETELPGHEETYWLDRDRDWVIVKYESSYRIARHSRTVGRTTIASVQYQNDATYGWVPSAWKTEWQNPDTGAIYDVEESKVVKYAFNEKIPSELFDLPFPPGTFVREHAQGNPCVYWVALPGGRKHVLTEAERNANATYQDILKRETEKGNRNGTEKGSGTVSGSVSGTYSSSVPGMVSQPAAEKATNFEPLDCLLVDEKTGEPLPGNDFAISLRYVIPRKGARPWQLVDEVVLGPNHPGTFKFTVPDKVLQHPDRDLIFVEWIIVHPRLDASGGYDPIRVNEILNDDPRSARQSIRRIKMHDANIRKGQRPEHFDEFTAKLYVLQSMNSQQIGRAEVIAAYERLLQRFPDHPDRAAAMFEIAMAWEWSESDPGSKRDEAKSIEWLRKACAAARPGTPLWYKSRFFLEGRVCWQSTEAAHKILDEILASHPGAADEVQAWYDKQSVLIMQNKPGEAEKICRQLQRLMGQEKLPVEGAELGDYFSWIRASADTMLNYWDQHPSPENKAKTDALRRDFPFQHIQSWVPESSRRKEGASGP